MRNCLFRTQDFRIRDLRYRLFLSLRHTGFGIQDFEIVFAHIASGHRILDSGFEILSFPTSLQGTGFGIWDLSECLFVCIFRAQDLGNKKLFYHYRQSLVAIKVRSIYDITAIATH